MSSNLPWTDPRRDANARGSCARLSVGEHPLGNHPHFNIGNRLRYCDACARLINRYRMTGKPLCSPLEETDE
jgi:hypothetical protein